MLTRTRSIRHLFSAVESTRRAAFATQPDPGEGEVPMITHLEYGAWVDMGAPDVITVTIEPGDRLND